MIFPPYFHSFYFHTLKGWKTSSTNRSDNRELNNWIECFISIYIMNDHASGRQAGKQRSKAKIGKILESWSYRVVKG